MSSSQGLRSIAQLIECDGPGGAERVVAHLATELAAQGHRVVVVVPEHGEGWLAGQLAGVNVTIEPFRLGRPVSPSALVRLARLLRRHRVAVAHSHEFTMGVYGAFAAALAGARHVTTMHGGAYYAERRRRRLALRAGVALSGALVAVSRPLARLLATDLRVPESRVAVIPNGVSWNPPPVLTLREELALGPADRLLVAVGNLYAVKGHRHLLDAVRLLGSTDPTVHLAIAGRGPEEPALKDQARRLELGDRLHLLGLRADVANLLCSADLFIHPSLSEGLPLALLEAMWAECPIVATNVGEVPRVLSDDAGLVVEAGDPHALAQAIHRLLRDRDLAARMGGIAGERARSEYGVEHMVRRYAAIYQELLRSPAGEGVAASGSSAWARPAPPV